MFTGEIFRIKNKSKGVALLITLSVTLILGLFLANNFERNRTNLKLLSNEESKFFFKYRQLFYSESNYTSYQRKWSKLFIRFCFYSRLSARLSHQLNKKAQYQSL